MSRKAILFCAAFAVALACLPTRAAQRSFVSSTGDDANLGAGCTPAAPCRVVAAASSGTTSASVRDSVSFECLGNNIVRQNTTASSGTITIAPGL